MTGETRRYFKCLRGIPEISEAHRDVTDEKGRIWNCIEVSKDEVLPPELLIELNTEQSTEAIHGCIIGCDDWDDLQEKLSDVVD